MKISRQSTEGGRGGHWWDECPKSTTRCSLLKMHAPYRFTVGLQLNTVCGCERLWNKLGKRTVDITGIITKRKKNEKDKRILDSDAMYAISGSLRQ